MRGDKRPGKKINLFEFIWLIIAVGIGLYVIFTANAEYNSSQKSIRESKETIESNDKKIKSNPMYQRIDEYGYRLNLTENIIEYKKYSLAWTNLIENLKGQLEKKVTVKGMQQVEDQNAIIVPMVGPSEDIVLQAIEDLEKNDFITGVDYTTITKEKQTFLGDKEQYFGYATIVNATIDENYLKEKYFQLLDAKEKQTENISAEDLESDGTGETLSGSYEGDKQ